MKRDINLIRDLLNIIEHADYPGVTNRYGLSPYDPRVQYHLRLLSEAGFIRSVGQTTDGAVSVRLTWQGHEFLEMSRNEEVWERAKRFVIERTQGLSAGALQATLAAWLQAAATEVEPVRYVEHRPVEAVRDWPYYAYPPAHAWAHYPAGTFHPSYHPNYYPGYFAAAANAVNGDSTNGAAKSSSNNSAQGSANGSANGSSNHGSSNANGRSKSAEARYWRAPLRLAPHYWWDYPHAADSHFQLQVTSTGAAEAMPVYGF